ncbi:MAG: TIR domain-containing protein [Magnetococcales bacterium]|nr:TIR domain-containing protein [Magnetococcales bacterium]
MSRIFISYSRQDRKEALGLRAWLREEGWDDVFLDDDPETGILPGQRWKDALFKAGNRCNVVLLLLSPNWLKSEWCPKEYDWAKTLKKQIIPILISNEVPETDLLIKEIIDKWQLINLVGGNDLEPSPAGSGEVEFSRSGKQRLKAGLDDAGIDRSFFEWPPQDDPNRAPYRGLDPLDEKDAGIFFGREDDIDDLLNRLDGLRALRPPRFLAILGASGAGKSSFLRAGVLPRLRRDDQNYLLLPIIRPGTGVMKGEFGLFECLINAFTHAGMSYDENQLNNSIAAGNAVLGPWLNQWVEKSSPSSPSGPKKFPTLILSIDQGEELFSEEKEKEAESKQFLDLLRDLLWAKSPDLIAMFTIRSDSFEKLQMVKELKEIRLEPFNLPIMPRGAFKHIIEGPIQRCQTPERPFYFDPKLTSSLLHDIGDQEGKDVLPLLAFTLEHLYKTFHGRNELLNENYRSMGKIKGAMQAAITRVMEEARKDPSLPRDEEERLRLLRHGLIPSLVKIDPETKSPRRRVAKRTEIPKESLPLIDLLIKERLLSSDTNTSKENIIEPAHEVLLHHWDQLGRWLKDEEHDLIVLERIRHSAKEWKDNSEGRDWLTHMADRLEDAERIVQESHLARILEPVDRDYLKACRELYDQRRDMESEAQKRELEAQKKLVRRTRAGLISALFLLGIALAGAWFGYTSRNTAIIARNHAESLVNFILFDLRDKLKPLGRLELLDMAANKAAAYFEQFGNLEDLSADQQRNAMAGFGSKGDIFAAQGQLTAALAAYQKALAINERLAAMDPNNADWQRDLFVSHNQIGDVFQAQGNLEGALDAFRSGMEIAKRLAAMDPNNADWQRDLSISHERIGDVFKAQGNLERALDVFRSGMEIAKRLAAMDPKNADWQRDLSVSYDRIGDVFKAQGNLEGALDAFRSGMEIAKRLAAMDPNNADWQRDLSISHERIGDVFKAQGNLERALDVFRSGMEIAKRLAAMDPKNADWQRDLSVSYDRIGDVFKAQGNLEGALDAFRSGMEITKRLAAMDPNNADWQRDLSISHERIGDVFQAQGNLEGALDAFRSRMEIAKRLAAMDPNNADWQRNLSISHNKIGDVFQAQGNLEGALDAFRSGMEIRKRLAAMDPNNADWQRDLSISHERIGDVFQAQGNLEGALDAFRSGMEIRKRLAAMDPNNADWQRDLAISNERMGTLLAIQGNKEEAVPYLRAAVAIVEAAFARFPNQKPFQFDLEGLRAFLDAIEKPEK